MYDFNKPWFNSKEAAAYLCLSEGALRNLVHYEKVPVYRLNRRLRFNKDELDELMGLKRMETRCERQDDRN